jgi:hypothetical protein
LGRPAGPPRGPGGGRVSEPELSPSLVMLATEAQVAVAGQSVGGEAGGLLTLLVASSKRWTYFSRSSASSWA